MPRVSGQLVHPARGHSGQVAVRHDGDQRGLGPLATLEQPLREIAARAQLRNGDVDGANPGVKGSVAVAVSVVGALGGPGVPFGAANGVGVR